jgi:hypothetical protein
MVRRPINFRRMSAFSSLRSPVEQRPLPPGKPLRRIAVISACNPYNYGVYSADLAAHRFFNELGVPFTQIVTQRRTHAGRLRFELLRDPARFAEFDAVVYWGDFLNNPMFGAREYVDREASRHKVHDPQQAWENWCALYLNLKRRHPALRVFALGGCFLGATGPALPPARTQVQEFIQSAELVTPRDDRSLAIVRQLAPGGRVLPGMDGAWLLPFAPRVPAVDSPYFVCFLGRTLRRKSRKFLRELARRTGLRLVWIDWMNLRRPRFIAHWNFERMHRWIAGARFVVTDTYHLTVNALNRGVRTVCLYDPRQDESDGTCGDAKKRLLFHQVGMASLLVDVHGERPLADRIWERLAAVDPQAEAEAFASLARSRAAYRATLLAALKPAGQRDQNPATVTGDLIQP